MLYPHGESDALPGRLNIGLSLAAWPCAAGCLWLASHAPNLALRVLGVIAFAIVNNMIFALLHESVHRCFHQRPWINEAFGVVSGAFFPLGLSLQRVFHLGHHRRNRTHYETFDYYFPEDSRFLKTVQWYGILSGVYWVVALLGSLLYFLVPAIARLPFVREPISARIEHTSATAFLRSFAECPKVRARLELLFALAFQIALFRLLDLELRGWLACYAAFAVLWSGFQYADHAFTPLDVRDGAWDLRVAAPVAAVLLNYHLHLAHHRHPGTAWIHLPRYADDSRPRPSLLNIYARMWLGPRPAPGPAAPADMERSCTG